MSWGILYIILQLNGGNLMRREVKAECRRILKEKWWSPLLIANLFIYFTTFLFDVLKTHILGDIDIKDIICGYKQFKSCYNVTFLFNHFNHTGFIFRYNKTNIFLYR